MPESILRNGCAPLDEAGRLVRVALQVDADLSKQNDF